MIRYADLFLLDASFGVNGRSATGASENMPAATDALVLGIGRAKGADPMFRIHGPGTPRQVRGIGTSSFAGLGHQNPNPEFRIFSGNTAIQIY